jgi:hypothetical protein
MMEAGRRGRRPQAEGQHGRPGDRLPHPPPAERGGGSGLPAPVRVRGAAADRDARGGARRDGRGRRGGDADGALDAGAAAGGAAAHRASQRGRAGPDGGGAARGGAARGGGGVAGAEPLGRGAGGTAPGAPPLPGGPRSDPDDRGGGSPRGGGQAREGGLRPQDRAPLPARPGRRPAGRDRLRAGRRARGLRALAGGCERLGRRARLGPPAPLRGGAGQLARGRRAAGTPGTRRRGGGGAPFRAPPESLRRYLGAPARDRGARRVDARRGGGLDPADRDQPRRLRHELPDARARSVPGGTPRAPAPRGGAGADPPRQCRRDPRAGCAPPRGPRRSGP